MFLLCRSCFPVLIVNLLILNQFNKNDLVNAGLIEIFLSSNCFTYRLEGDPSDSIETGCVLTSAEQNQTKRVD